MHRLPEIVKHKDGYGCTKHGSQVVETLGRWTGRTMMECSECGAFLVVPENRTRWTR